MRAELPTGTGGLPEVSLAAAASPVPRWNLQERTEQFIRRSPRVVHVVPTLFDEQGRLIGGAERYVLELARHMAEVVPTTLVSFGDRDERRTIGRLELRVLGRPRYVKGQRGNPLHRGLLPELRQARIIHVHQPHVLASSLTAAFARLTGRRVFATDLGGGGWDISAYVSTDGWYTGHLHISEYSRSIYGHADYPRARVILGGVDTTHFSPDTTIAKPGKVLFVGRLLPHKGVDDLIRALPADLELDVIGRPHDVRFLAHLRTLASGKRVIFRHDCDDRALIRAYREALCIVLPSVYKSDFGGESLVPELLGQTLLEGMACGTAAICTDVASMPEIVHHEMTGFIVPPNDPATLGQRLEELRRDPARAREMGARAREVVRERFTWEAVVDRCLDAYAG